MRMKRKNNVVILFTIVLVMMVITTSVNGGSSMVQHPREDRHFTSLGYKFTPPGNTIHVPTTSGTINLQPSMNDESSSSSSDDEDRHRKAPKEKDATSYEQDFGDIPKTATTTTCNETGYAGTNGTPALITIDFYYGIESLSALRTDELHSFVFPEVDRIITDALLPLVVPPPCADVGRLDPFHWNRQRRLDRVGIAPYPDEAVLTDVLCPFNLTESSHACIVIGAAFTSFVNDNNGNMMDESKRFLDAIEQMMEEGALDNIYPEKVVRIVLIQFGLVKNVAQLPEPPPQRTVDVTPTAKEEDGDDGVKWYWWLLLAIAIALLLLILYLYYRRRSEYRKFDDEGNSDIEPTLDADEEAAETSNPFLL